jgi:hypothetical protein
LLIKLKEDLAEYKKMISSYKSQLKNMNEKLRRDQEEEHRDLIPMMREFNANVMKKMQEEENLDVYYMHKELDELDKDRVNLQRQSAFSERRIEDLEKFVGVSAFKRMNADGNIPDTDEIDSP